MIPAHLVASVREATGFPALVSEYVALYKIGTRYRARCLFHEEKTASMIVFQDHFHCFGCGVGGDCFRFLCLIEKIPFQESVKRLADRAGIALENRPVSRVAMAYAREQAEFCRWWVKRQHSNILGLAMEHLESDYEFSLSCSEVLRRLRDSTPGDLFGLFVRLHTAAEREDWMAEIGRERALEEWLRGRAAA